MDAVTVLVHLLDVPLAVRQRALEHSEEVRREVTLILAGGEKRDLNEVFIRVSRFGSDLPDAYHEMAASMRTQLDAAAAGGRKFVDVHCLVSHEAVAAIARMDDLFDELDGLSRSQELLTLAAPPDLNAFRRWLLGQYRSQLDGAPPVSWPRWAATAGVVVPDTEETSPTNDES